MPTGVAPPVDWSESDAASTAARSSQTSPAVDSSRPRARESLSSTSALGTMRPVSTLDTVGCPTPARWANTAPVRPASARSPRRRAPSTFVRSRRSLPMPRVLHHAPAATGAAKPCRPSDGTELSSISRDRTRQQPEHDSNFLYWFKAPAAHSAARAARRPGRRSCLRPASPRPPAARLTARVDGRRTHHVAAASTRLQVKTMPPAGALRLRDGGGPYAGAGRRV